MLYRMYKLEAIVQCAVSQRSLKKSGAFGIAKVKDLVPSKYCRYVDSTWQ